MVSMVNMYLTGPPAAAAGLTVVDLTSGTEADPKSLKGAGTDLSAGTFEIAAVHGNIDSGLDCYTNLQSIGARPAGKIVLHMVLTCSTPATEDPGSSHAYFGLFVAPSTTLTSTQGFHVSLMTTNAPATKLGKPKRPGTAPQAGVVYAGAGEIHLFVAFDGTTAAAAFTAATGATSGYDEGSELNNSGGTWSDVYVGCFAAQLGAAPSSVVTYAGLTVSYEWL